MDEQSERKQGDFSVVMISTDPAFAKASAGTGDAVERHRRYAAAVRSLDVVVLAGSKAETKKTDDHLTLHIVGAKGALAALRGLAIARRICTEKKCSLIVTQDPHLTGWIGARLKKQFRIPLIVNFHGDFWNNAHWLSEHWSHQIKQWLQRKIVPQADGIRVVSDGIRRSLLSSGISDERIAVVHTPINDQAFIDFTEEQKILLEKLRYKFEGKFIILFCGRLVAAKNLALTLDAIDRLRKTRPNIAFLALGDGEQRTALEQIVVEKRLQQVVTFLGALPQDKISVYYRLANVLVLLSTNESFGKVIIEAGLVGTPSLASTTTGAASIIQDGTTGFLIPINDVQAAADVLDEMIEETDQTKQLGQWASEKYREQYASEKTVQRILAFWNKIAART